MVLDDLEDREILVMSLTGQTIGLRGRDFAVFKYEAIIGFDRLNDDESIDTTDEESDDIDEVGSESV